MTLFHAVKNADQTTKGGVVDEKFVYVKGILVEVFDVPLLKRTLSKQFMH